MSRSWQLTTLGVILLLLTGFSARSMDLVPQAYQSAIVGGQTTLDPVFCIKTNTTCPDTTYSADCAIAIDGTCKQCFMNVASWTECGTTFGGITTCSQTQGPTSPWCGVTKSGTPVNGSCVGQCGGGGFNCGMQIPTVTGQPCPS